MTLAWSVDKAFTALAEDVAAKQRQGLGQFGVFFLQLIVICRGPIEHAFELIDAALSVFGLLPQLVVAAEQVVEQPLAIARIVRESWCDAHNMKYTRSFMLFQCSSDAFIGFSGLSRGWNRLRWRAVRRSIPESSMASCAAGVRRYLGRGPAAFGSFLPRDVCTRLPARRGRSRGS